MRDLSMFLELCKCELDMKRSKNDYKLNMGGGEIPKKRFYIKLKSEVNQPELSYHPTLFILQKSPFC